MAQISLCSIVNVKTR